MLEVVPVVVKAAGLSWGLEEQAKKYHGDDISHCRSPCEVDRSLVERVGRLDFVDYGRSAHRERATVR